MRPVLPNRPFVPQKVDKTSKKISEEIGKWVRARLGLEMQDKPIRYKIKAVIDLYTPDICAALDGVELVALIEGDRKLPPHHRDCLCVLTM